MRLQAKEIEWIKSSQLGGLLLLFLCIAWIHTNEMRYFSNTYQCATSETVKKNFPYDGQWMMVIIVHYYYSVLVNNRSMILCILKLLDRQPDLIMMPWSIIFWLQKIFNGTTKLHNVFHTKCTLENQIWCECSQHAKPCLCFGSTMWV